MHLLSDTQRHLWFAEQLGTHPSGYLVPILLKLVGPLDVAALCGALAGVVARHETLRTSMHPSDDGPVGVVRPPDAAGFDAIVSIGDLEAAGGLDELLRAELTTPLDAVHNLPIRARLIRLADEEHVLCIVVHHVAFDDWSRGVLYAELSELYNSSVDGRAAVLRPLELRYREFVAAAGDRRTRDEVSHDLGYWCHTLSDLTPFEFLPERPRPSRRAGLGAAMAVTVPPEIGDRLAEIGREHGATLAMVLFSACQVVLRHYSGRDDVTVGTAVALRDEPAAEPLIGPLINLLVLRGDTADDPTFGELVERMRDLLLDAYEHREVPFASLVERLWTDRDHRHTPLFQILVGCGSGTRTAPHFNGLAVTELDSPCTGSKYDLSFWFDRYADGRIVCRVTWDISLFEAASMHRLARRLGSVMAEAARLPDAAIGALTTLSATELDVVCEFSVGPQLSAGAGCVHDGLERQVKLTPQAPAVVGSDGAVTTYATLNARANEVAHRLRSLGVGPEQIVGVCAERSVELVVALFGVLKAGAGYLPLDPEFPTERLAYMCRDASAPVILVQRHLRERLPANGAAVLVLDDPATWAGAPTDDPTPLATPDNLAYVLYTSGSTGRPKGVVMRHRGVVVRLDWMQKVHRLSSTDAVLHRTSMSFDVSVPEFFWPLSTGARLVLARSGEHRDTRYLRDLIAVHRVTVAQFVPSLLTAFVNEEGVEACTSLRLVVSAGEELPLSTTREFLALLPACELHNGYGPTEAAVYVNFWQCRPADLSGLTSVPLGDPFADTQTYILDGDLRMVAPGAIGELYLGGTGVARGYLNQPALTGERFLPDPYSTEPGSRLYRTGDLVRLRPDGRSMEFLGRVDHQVKVRGFRIELGEVEATLCAHPAVDECVAIMRHVGSGDPRLVAYVTTATAGYDVGELRAFLSERLPAPAVPSAIVHLDALPRTPSGKLNRKALPEPDANAVMSGDHTSPRSDVEIEIAAIWSDVLGVRQIGVYDNFFTAGGHSLLALRAVNRMRDSFEIDMPLSVLFECPTVAAMARRVERINHRHSGRPPAGRLTGPAVAACTRR